MNPSGSSGLEALRKTGRSQLVRSWDWALDPCKPVFQVVMKTSRGAILQLSLERQGWLGQGLAVV